MTRTNFTFIFIWLVGAIGLATTCDSLGEYALAMAVITGMTGAAWLISRAIVRRI